MSVELREFFGKWIWTDEPGQSSLSFPIDNLQLQARFLFDAFEKFSTVFRSATGFRGNQPDVPDGPRRQFFCAGLQRFHRAVHRILIESAGSCEPLPQPHDAGIGVNHAKAPGMLRDRHEKAAIVGAKIQRRIGIFALRSRGTHLRIIAWSWQI